MSILIKVVFPAPLFPSKAVISFEAKVSEKSYTAGFETILQLFSSKVEVYRFLDERFFISVV